MNALLSTTYFGPVQWYQKLALADSAAIDHGERYQKQTYRNRCLIATTQGVQALTVPIEKARLTRDVRISDHGEWRHLHWHALMSAYGDSPFFEYYQDDLRPFFDERRWTFLVDFNEEIRQTVCQLIDLHPAVELADGPATADSRPGYADYRLGINPKRPADDPDFEPRPYYQVYQRKHGFLPNLSILDLLFNTGSESILHLLTPKNLQQ